MSKAGIVAVVLSILPLACATSSSQPEARSTAQPKPGVAPPAVAAATEAPLVPAAAFMTRPKLQPGHCQDGFDCVDTVGFPPSGYRWSCDNGKCSRAKLPSIGGEQPAAVEGNTTAVAGKAKAKNSKQRKQAD